MKNEKVPKTVRGKRFSGSKNGKLIRKGRRVDLKTQKMGDGKKIGEILDIQFFLKFEVAVLNF